MCLDFPRLRVGLLLTGLMVFLGGCQFLYPEQEPEDLTNSQKPSDEPLFEASDYSRNAKTYFDAGDYARAKDQWSQELRRDPASWMARLGVASCDYHLGSTALDRGDVKAGRELLARSETQARELWNGQIETDTREAEVVPIAQWKAALILSKAQRGLGDADQLQSIILTQGLSSTTDNEEKKHELLAARMKFEKQRDANWSASRSLLQRLVNMKHPSEDAVINFAEVNASLGDLETAEEYFQDYMAICERSRTVHEQTRREIEENPNPDSKIQDSNRQLIASRLSSNSQKHASVLVRLGNISYDRGTMLRAQAQAPVTPPARRKELEGEAKKHYSAALDHLHRASEVCPERQDVLVKIAQCQGEMGLYEPAIANLDIYIRDCGERNDPFDDNLKRAYRMKREYEMKLQKPKR